MLFENNEHFQCISVASNNATYWSTWHPDNHFLTWGCTEQQFSTDDLKIVLLLLLFIYFKSLRKHFLLMLKPSNPK